MSVGISKGHNGDLTRDGSLIKKCLWRQGERARKFGGGKADVLFKRLSRKCVYDVAELKVKENKKENKTVEVKWDGTVTEYTTTIEQRHN